MPSLLHGHAQSKLSVLLAPYCAGVLRGSKSAWWIASEVEVLLADCRALVRPDVAGWTKKRMPDLTEVWPVELCPDWVCEVVSKEDARRDVVTKRALYARAGIPHFWLLDLRTDRVTALRLAGDSYVVESEAGRGGMVRAAPFELIEIRVDDLFGRVASPR